ncbi:hypothetical protein BJY04DRAFT_197291 [Aspergillus karnatakaensis]|uniref:uncharacterized protein n=1 Tax=Aspergillus karnatakaensis TaxID=1810916 RepID=UPI003CCD3EE3
MQFSKIYTLALLAASASASPTPQQSSQIVSLRNAYQSFCNSASNQIGSLSSQFGNVGGQLGNGNLNSYQRSFQDAGGQMTNACAAIVNTLNQYI